MYLSSRFLSSRIFRWSASAVVLLSIAAFFGLPKSFEQVDACGGDPPEPVCTKQLSFTYEIPKTVCDTGDGSTSIKLDIDTYIYLNVLASPPGSDACPFPPYDGVLEFTIKCPDTNPAAPANVVVITQNVPDIPSGVAKIVPVELTVPPGPVPRKCIVSAKLTVSFSDGTVISYTPKDKCICVVECVDNACPEDPNNPDSNPNDPNNPLVPRLALCNLLPGIASIHPGDQTGTKYVICNNDPNNFFTGFLSVESSNEGRRPIDETPGLSPPGTGVGAISSPLVGDDFPISFGDRLPPEGCIILPRDPFNFRNPTIRRPMLLAPCEWIEVDIITRPWGMCANGSCGNQTLTLHGRFSDGTNGLACASAVVALDNNKPPQFQWPDSGVVGTVCPIPGISGLQAGASLPPTLVGVDGGHGVAVDSFFDIFVDSSQCRFLGNEGRDVEHEIVQQVAEKLSAVDENGLPRNNDYGRSTSRVQIFSQQPLFGVDSFFDVVYPIELLPHKGQLVISGIGASGEGAVLSPEDPGTGMLELRVSDPETDANSFFDVTYQISLDGRNETGSWDTEIVSLVLRNTSPTSFEVQARVRARPRQSIDNKGGLPIGPEVANVHHDFRIFARPGPLNNCPKPTIKNLFCLPGPNGQAYALTWDLDPSTCKCPEIRIVNQTPNGPILIQSLPGGTTSAMLDCRALQQTAGGAQSGVLCVQCILPDPTNPDATPEVCSEECCEWSCDGCPPIDITRCEVLNNGCLVIMWPAPPENCCTEIQLIGFDSAGNELSAPLAVTAGGSCDFKIFCDELVARTGTTGGNICVRCIGPDGSIVSEDCCNWDCPGSDCPRDYSLDCQFDAVGQQLTMSWAPTPPPGCCDNIQIRDQGTNAVVATLPGTASSITLSCEEIIARTGSSSGVLCVYCVDNVAGAVKEMQIGCCEYECEETDDCAEEYQVQCDYSNPGLAVEFWIAPSLEAAAICCDRIIVGVPDPADVSRPGTIVTEIQGAVSKVPVTCSEIHAAGLPPAGTLCIWCEESNGLIGGKTLTLMGCCDYSCRDCPDPGLTCTTTDDGVAFSWNTNISPDCCERFLIRVPSNPPQVLAALPNVGTIPSTIIDCESLRNATGQTSGVVCLVCVAPDGSETEVCCDWSCPKPCEPKPLEILRCDINADGNLKVLWNQHSPECCGKFLVTVDGVVATTADAGANMATIVDFCEIYGPGAHEICVICIDPETGAPVSKDCCKVECGGDCDIRVTCEPAEDATGMSAILVSWATSGNCDCDRFLITFGADAITVPGSVTSVTIPCAKLPGTGGVICVRCLRTDGTTVGVGCCDYQCPQDDPPCNEKCTYDGCNRVKSTTWLCPDQIDFEVFISLRTICGNMVIKSCRPSFRLSDIGFSNGHFMTLQQKCRALVDAINNDPCCQALGYKVLPGDDHCDLGPDGCFCDLGTEDCPWFIVTDTLCPSGQLVMGVSNDPNVLDQQPQGPLPDYEAEHIQTLWGDPTPGDGPNGDEPGATVTLEGEATGDPIVTGNGLGGNEAHVPHIRLTGSSGDLQGDSRFEIFFDVLLATKAGDTAEELAQMAAMMIQAELAGLQLRGDVQAVGKTLTISNIGPSGEDGAAAGVTPSGGFGFSATTNDTGVSFGTSVGPSCALDGDLSDCPSPPSTGGAQQPGDMDGSGSDFSDQIAILGYLFLGVPESLPCGDGSIDHPANLTLLDADGSGGITFGDPIYMLNWQFLGGPGHVEGEDCIRIPLCPKDSRECNP